MLFILPNQAVNSVRAVGDIIESLISAKFNTFLGAWCSEYTNKFERCSMANLAFVDSCPDTPNSNVIIYGAEAEGYY